MMKRALIALVTAVACTLTLALAAFLVGGTFFARLVLLAGGPLSSLFVRLLPDGVVYAIAPEGGAAATAAVFALSALLTWLVFFWIVAFVWMTWRGVRGRIGA